MNGESGACGNCTDTILGVANVDTLILCGDPLDPETFIVQNVSPADWHFSIVSSPEDFGQWIAPDPAGEFGRLISQNCLIQWNQVEKWFHCKQKKKHKLIKFYFQFLFLNFRFKITENYDRREIKIVSYRELLGRQLLILSLQPYL